MEKSKLRKAVKLEAAGLTEEYRAMADGQILTRLLLHPDICRFHRNLTLEKLFIAEAEGIHALPM